MNAGSRAHLQPLYGFFELKNRFLLHVMLAQYMLSSCVCACPSLCAFVTHRYCSKTAKLRITQTMAQDNLGSLVFLHQKSWWNSNGVAPNRGANCRWSSL